jgi:hypothetical protein
MKEATFHYELEGNQDGVAIPAQGTLLAVGAGTTPLKMKYALVTNSAETTAVVLWRVGTMKFSPSSPEAVFRKEETKEEETHHEYNVFATPPQIKEAKAPDSSLRYALVHKYEKLPVEREGVIRFCTPTDKRAAELLIAEHRREIERLRTQIKQGILTLSRGVVKTL